MKLTPSRHTKNADTAAATRRRGDGEAEGEGNEEHVGGVAGVELRGGVAEVEGGTEVEDLQVASFSLAGCVAPPTVPRKDKGSSSSSRVELTIRSARRRCVCLLIGFVHHIW